jgi:hypothetical protein
MVGFEMLPRQSDKFAVCQMIETFNPNDLCHQLRVMPRDMLDQLVLGLSGAGNEHRASVVNSLCYVLEITGIDSRVTATDGVGLMMDMARRIVGVNDEPVSFGDIEMKNPGFEVVDPDDRMIVTGHQRPFPIAFAQRAE